MRRHSLDLPEALGFDRRQLDAILGDLGEERRERAHIYGRAFALAWWLREILRSAPHLIVDAMRRGSPAERQLRWRDHLVVRCATADPTIPRQPVSTWKAYLVLLGTSHPWRLTCGLHQRHP